MVAVDHTHIHLYFREINCIYSIKCIAKEDDTYKRRAHMKMNINILYIKGIYIYGFLGKIQEEYFSELKNSSKSDNMIRVILSKKVTKKDITYFSNVIDILVVV